MLRTRLVVGLTALPFIIGIILWGGWLYVVTATILLALGIRELIMLGKAEGYAPSLILGLFILVVILLAVFLPDILGPGLVVGILLAMGSSLYHFYQGDETPLNSFAITLGIGLLIGWLGQYFILLRAFPQGGWWTLLTMFCVFAADSGGYLVGKRFGRHKMSPKASPKKSWEGYFGGVGFALVWGGIFGAGFHLAAPAISWLDGVVLGGVISVLAPVGDLTVSMFKRQAHVKDASQLIPGHGGIMDRLDTVLIAATLGFYYVLWFV